MLSCDFATFRPYKSIILRGYDHTTQLDWTGARKSVITKKPVVKISSKFL
jgi:hypothetical protein